MMALGFPAVANLGPTWITTVVGVSFRNFGFVAITWGAGAFLTSLFLARFPLLERRGTVLAIATIAFALSFLIFTVPTIPTAVIGNLGLGIALAAAQISSMTLVQQLVPNEVRGRVMSLLQLNMGIAQLMTLPLAAIAQATSLETLFPALAVSVLVVVILVVATQRHIWSAGSRRAAAAKPAEAPAEERQPSEAQAPS
jgi:predicted MFS family arabinose efflux permease